MQTTNNPRRTSRHRNRGAALMLSLFVIFMVSSLVLNVLNTETLQFAAARNIQDYERALYLANAGVHHAIVTLDDPTLRGSFDVGLFPAEGSYRYTINDCLADDGEPVAGVVEVVATGAAGNVQRSVTAVLNL